MKKSLISVSKNMTNNRFIVGRHYVDRKSTPPTKSNRKVTFETTDSDIDQSGQSQRKKVDQSRPLVDKSNLEKTATDLSMYSDALKRSRASVEFKIDTIEQKQQQVLNEVDHNQQATSVDQSADTWSVDQLELSDKTWQTMAKLDTDKQKAEVTARQLMDIEADVKEVMEQHQKKRNDSK